MQLNAINSMNFKGYGRPAVIDADDYEIIRDNNQPAGNIDAFIKDVNKANNDVNPLTCVLGLLAGVATLKTGSKAVGIARSALAKFGSEISQSAIKTSGKISKNLDVDTECANVAKFFSKFTNETDIKTPDAKITGKVTEVIDAVFGKNKSKGTIETLNKNGIFLNARSLFDNGVALAGAIAATDVVSDVTEDSIDKKNIQNSALKNLNIYRKMSETVINDLLA